MQQYAYYSNLRGSTPVFQISQENPEVVDGRYEKWRVWMLWHICWTIRQLWTGSPQACLISRDVDKALKILHSDSASPNKICHPAPRWRSTGLRDYRIFPP